MAQKRTGNGGNTSRNAQNNLVAHSEYIKKHKKDSKSCTGFIHHDGVEVDVRAFRQSTVNNQTGLQSRCDICNRLYFSILQKPKVRIVAIGIYARANNISKVIDSCPASIKPHLNKAIDHYFNSNCKARQCDYRDPHGDFRDSVEIFTRSVSGLEKGRRDSTVSDSKTGVTYAAPRFMHDMQDWGSSGGALYDLVDTSEVWKWWVSCYSLDFAYCSEERNEEKNNSEFLAVAHPVGDFPWGSGNFLETTTGHTLPGFNKVRSSASILPNSSNIGERAYGYLCEGDHLAMARFSKECKKEGLSLGHTPAPLRWFGKNDPINAKKEPLDENVLKRDSLIELHQVSVSSPPEAGNYVSWQIRDKVIELGKRQVSFEQFTIEIQAAVEKYLDELTDQLLKDDGTRIFLDLQKADPGKTQTVYQYRFEKVKKFLTSRPSHLRKKSK